MQLVGSANASEDSIRKSDGCRVRWHEAAGVGKKCDQGDLPDIRALSGHVGAGDQQE